MDPFVAWNENIAEATEMATAEQHPLEQLLVTLTIYFTIQKFQYLFLMIMSL